MNKLPSPSRQSHNQSHNKPPNFGIVTDNRLLELRDSQLYRDTQLSFEAFCRERWQLGKSRSYQLMDAAKVIENL
jgi:hypothetical protein